MVGVRLCTYLFAISEQVSKDSLRCNVEFWLGFVVVGLVSSCISLFKAWICIGNLMPERDVMNGI